MFVTLHRMAEEEIYYGEALEEIFEVVNIYDGEEQYLASIAQLPRPLVLLLAAHFSQYEIPNGGLQQLFKNSTGIVAPEAIEGFNLIGMTKTASLLEMALSDLGTPYPRDRGERRQALMCASGLDETDLNDYTKVNGALGWGFLDRTAWNLLDIENGGFEAAANRYVADHKAVGSNNPSPHPPQQE